MLNIGSVHRILFLINNRIGWMIIWFMPFDVEVLLLLLYLDIVVTGTGT